MPFLIPVSLSNSIDGKKKKKEGRKKSKSRSRGYLLGIGLRGKTRCLLYNKETGVRSFIKVGGRRNSRDGVVVIILWSTCM